MSDGGCEKEDEDKLTERWAEWAEWNQTEWTGRKKQSGEGSRGDWRGHLDKSKGGWGTGASLNAQIYVDGSSVDGSIGWAYFECS